MTTNNTNTDKRNTVIETIIEWFKENEEVFNDCIEELDSWNGYLGDDRYYSMYELDELYNGSSPLEILQRAFYGYDDDTSSENSHTEFNPNRDYFRFNGYGNLVSTDYKDYSDHIDHWAVENMAENRQHIDSIDDEPELSELFDALEADDAEDE